jgi:hypothetical protein
MTAPAMVRNTAAGPTVFSEGPNATVEWAGANDPMGGDLQPVPESFLNNVQFHRMAARGILVVETADEAIQAALAQHKAEWDTRQARQRDASRSALDEAPNNDSVIKTCLGPSGRDPRQLCGADVPIRQAKLAETVPLCPMHSGLAGQFIAEESDRIVNGKPEIVWLKTNLGATTRQD